MGFLRFYGRVFREAFRHSLDIAQAAAFLLFILAGLVVYAVPAVKMTVEALQLNGWQIGFGLLASIFVMRLVLAPYWLWRAAQDRIVSTPQNNIDYQLRVVSFGNRNDRKKKLIQIVFNLRNALPVPLKYEVEKVDATVAGDRNDKPVFQNMGAVVPAQSISTFDYSPIALTGKSWIKPGTEGTASITYKYGIAGRSFVRRATFTAKIIIEKRSIRHLVIEDSEENV
jgi:hypothetical protein